MWHIHRQCAPRSGCPDHQVRVVLETDDWSAIGYRLPVVELVETAHEDDAVGHLGPDLLDPAFDRDEALRRLLADPTREVGQALLDQRLLAGIGNIYKTETLFVRRTSPWTPVGEVDDPGALVDTARRLLDANKAHASQATTGDPRRGHEHWVYGRAGRPCRRCGTTVRQFTQGQRSTYWCPRCQR